MWRPTPLSAVRARHFGLWIAGATAVSAVSGPAENAIPKRWCGIPISHRQHGNGSLARDSHLAPSFAGASFPSRTAGGGIPIPQAARERIPSGMGARTDSRTSGFTLAVRPPQPPPPLRNGIRPPTALHAPCTMGTTARVRVPAAPPVLPREGKASLSLHRRFLIWRQTQHQREVAIDRALKLAAGLGNEGVDLS
jgi:hypothetical protein